MPQRVRLTAASRLHFGMLAFGQSEGRQFGGAGVMVDRPALDVQFTAANEWQVSGPLAERMRRMIADPHVESTLRNLPKAKIEILTAPPEHAGLGVGTQLSLSVVAGLRALAGLPALAPAELATATGRAQRSSVGTYGFCLGGMIVEAGKLPGESIAPLICRLELPSEWRFVLVRPPHEAGLSGQAEREAFHQLPAVPGEVTAELTRELHAELIPAAQAGDFARFSYSLYRYGHLAGMCFSARQGGAYASPALSMLVERIRSLGSVGVGQSSWGPTIFGLVDSDRSARQLAEELDNRGSNDVWVCGAKNSPPTIQLLAD